MNVIKSSSTSRCQHNITLSIVDSWEDNGSTKCIWISSWASPSGREGRIAAFTWMIFWVEWIIVQSFATVIAVWRLSPVTIIVYKLASSSSLIDGIVSFFSPFWKINKPTSFELISTSSRGIRWTSAHVKSGLSALAANASTRYPCRV